MSLGLAPGAHAPAVIFGRSVIRLYGWDWLLRVDAVASCPIEIEETMRCLSRSMFRRGLRLLMPKRHLRVLKWLGTTPAIAACTSCNREFRVPLELLKRVAGSQEYLKLEFSRHVCEDEAGVPLPPDNA